MSGVAYNKYLENEGEQLLHNSLSFKMFFVDIDKLSLNL